MAQQRDPIVYQMQDVLRAAPENVLVTPKAAQPTRASGVLQAVMYIERVGLMNEDHAGGVVDIGFMVGSNVHWYWTLVLTTATYWYWAFVQWTLTSDYQVVSRWRLVTQDNGNYVNDIARMNVNGYYLEPYSSP